MSFALDPVERRVVDNRLFIIGLDDLYRDSMAEFESTRLLECARTVARALGTGPAAVPVEGYYADNERLTEYFRLSRALQNFDEDQAWRVQHLPEFSLLHSIATSGLYGRPEAGQLIPRSRDALWDALDATAPGDWSVPLLVERARAAAIATGDFSLVALAARAGDPVAIAATRESVALHSAVYEALDEEPPEYDWQVDDELSVVADKFIQTFNLFGGPPLPPAQAGSAADYYDAAIDVELAGRCIAIGYNLESRQHYHWAIADESMGDLQVEQFWDPDLWTTSRYRSERINKGEW